jgi:segregation and condensation protein B
MSKSVRPKGLFGLSGLAAQAEALLFVAASPVKDKEFMEVLGISALQLSETLEELGLHFKRMGHGIELHEIAGGWQLMTSPHFAQQIVRFRDVAQRQRTRLSKASVETLAIVAYRQPVTRSEIEEIRGVRSDRVVETLLSNGLVRIAGRRKGSGSPLLYRTTERFLSLFGLEAIADLPTFQELEELFPGNIDLIKASRSFTEDAAVSSEESEDVSRPADEGGVEP